jgi:hypothetical protein
VNLPQIHYIFLKCATFFSNPPPLSTNPQLFLKTRRSWPKVTTGVGGGDGLGRHLVIPLLAVKSSSFALLSLIESHLGSFIDENCPS